MPSNVSPILDGVWGYILLFDGVNAILRHKKSSLTDKTIVFDPNQYPKSDGLSIGFENPQRNLLCAIDTHISFCHTSIEVKPQRL